MTSGAGTPQKRQGWTVVEAAGAAVEVRAAAEAAPQGGPQLTAQQIPRDAAGR
jgi:hypothetical protein